VVLSRVNGGPLPFIRQICEVVKVLFTSCSRGEWKGRGVIKGSASGLRLGGRLDVDEPLSLERVNPSNETVREGGSNIQR
jgi:hypothetical protein